jgi:hypothetical protein
VTENYPAGIIAIAAIKDERIKFLGTEPATPQIFT